MSGHQYSDFVVSRLPSPLNSALYAACACASTCLNQMSYHATAFSEGDHETQYNRAYEEWPSSVRQFLIERRLDEWKLQLFIVILLTRRK